MHQSVTLKQVAALAGVSYQTVSKVLNRTIRVSKATEERIFQAAEQLGYHPNQPARNMRTRRSLMIGYAWEWTERDQRSHIFSQFLTGMMEEAQGEGYHLLPFFHRQGEERIDDYLTMFRSGRVDGFVFSSVFNDDPRLAFLMERRIPFVTFGRSSAGLDFCSVDFDGADGARQAVEHLVKRGHQRIAVIAWQEDSLVGGDRMQGYYQTMQAAGLPILEGWIQRGADDDEFGLAAVRRLLDFPPGQRPSAVITFSDAQAAGALRGFHERRLHVGRDVAVIGFDDAPMGQYLNPPLTTIRQPIHFAAQKCVEILVSLMKGGVPAERRVLLKPALILRATA